MQIPIDFYGLNKTEKGCCSYVFYHIAYGTRVHRKFIKKTIRKWNKLHFSLVWSSRSNVWMISPRIYGDFDGIVAKCGSVCRCYFCCCSVIFVDSHAQAKHLCVWIGIFFLWWIFSNERINCWQRIRIIDCFFPSQRFRSSFIFTRRKQQRRIKKTPSCLFLLYLLFHWALGLIRKNWSSVWVFCRECRKSKNRKKKECVSNFRQVNDKRFPPNRQSPMKASSLNRIYSIFKIKPFLLYWHQITLLTPTLSFIQQYKQFTRLECNDCYFTKCRTEQNPSYH